MKTWTKDGINYVSYAWNHVEKEILKREIKEVTGIDGGIEVCELTSGADEPIQMGVNWAAFGTVSGEDAVAFACKLLYASELARDYRYNGYVVSYEDGCMWSELSSKEQMELKEYAARAERI